jgi:hypothetical protein
MGPFDQVADKVKEMQGNKPPFMGGDDKQDFKPKFKPMGSEGEDNPMDKKEEEDDDKDEDEPTKEDITRLEGKLDELLELVKKL